MIKLNKSLNAGGEKGSGEKKSSQSNNDKKMNYLDELKYNMQLWAWLETLL